MALLKMTGIFAAGFAAGCAALAVAGGEHTSPKPAGGSIDLLVEPLETAVGFDAIISELSISAGAKIPRHYHPGEELVFVVEGSLLHIEDDADDRLYSAGEAFLIRKGKIHAPRGGETGGRAIVFRVHPQGEPVRIAAE